MTIDRTQWELGKSKINFLVVAAPCKRMAISLFWILLSKKGNFNYKERVELQDLRCLLIHGARAVLQSRNRREDAMGDATVISLPKRF
ncbi:MAG: hypothetical protein OXC48_04310 [Endozoicomonadaceae bacterium]|nr:hypothetical protein [Endozoicomonadaceae bacterium]